MLTDAAKEWFHLIAKAGAWITMACAAVGHWGWRDGMALMFAFSIAINAHRRRASQSEGSDGSSG